MTHLVLVWHAEGNDDAGGGAVDMCRCDAMRWD